MSEEPLLLTSTVTTNLTQPGSRLGETLVLERQATENQAPARKSLALSQKLNQDGLYQAR